MKRYNLEDHGDTGTLTLKIIEGSDLVVTKPVATSSKYGMKRFSPFFRTSSSMSSKSSSRGFAPDHIVCITSSLVNFEDLNSNAPKVNRIVTDYVRRGIVKTSARIIASGASTSNATWNEEFTFQNVQKNMAVKITCLNMTAEKGGDGEDDIVGETLVPVTRLPDNVPVEQWYQLHPPASSGLSFIKSAVRLRLCINRNQDTGYRATPSTNAATPFSSSPMYMASTNSFQISMKDISQSVSSSSSSPKSSILSSPISDAPRVPILQISETHQELSYEILPSGLVDYFVIIGPKTDEDGRLQEQISNPTGFGAGLYQINEDDRISTMRPVTSIELAGDILDVYPRKPRTEAPPTNHVEWFCFPGGMFLCASPHQPKPYISSFVRLISGMRSYGICLIYYCLADRSTLPRQSGTSASRMSSVLLWVPMCLCVLTRLPVPGQLTPWLISFYRHMEEGLKKEGGKMTSSFTERLHQAVFELTYELPIPIPRVFASGLSLFPKNESVIRFSLNSESDLPTLSFDLRILLNSLGSRALLQVLSAVLQESKILFHSKKIGILSVIAEGILSLMYPFQWSYSYVPVLPRVLAELVEAPQSFILGMHSDWLADLPPNSLADTVVVDCDLGTVSSCSMQFEPLPPSIHRALSSAIRRTLNAYSDSNTDLSDLPLQLSSKKSSKKDLVNEEQILRVSFMHAMADVLFGCSDCIFFIDDDRPVFNAKLFLQEYCREEYVPFTSRIIETMAFKYLLENLDHLNTSAFLRHFESLRQKAFQKGCYSRRTRELFHHAELSKIDDPQLKKMEVRTFVIPPSGILPPELKLDAIPAFLTSQPSVSPVPRRRFLTRAESGKRILHVDSPSGALQYLWKSQRSTHQSGFFGGFSSKLGGVAMGNSSRTSLDNPDISVDDTLLDDAHLLLERIRRKRGSQEGGSSSWAVDSSTVDRANTALSTTGVSEHYSSSELCFPLSDLKIWPENILLPEETASLRIPRTFTVGDVGHAFNLNVAEMIVKQAATVKSLEIKPISDKQTDTGHHSRNISKSEEDFNRDSEQLCMYLENILSCERVSEDIMFKIEKLMKESKAARKRFLMVLSQGERKSGLNKKPFLLHGTIFEALARLSYTLCCECVTTLEYDTARELLRLTGNYIQVHEGNVQDRIGSKQGDGYFMEYLSSGIQRHPMFSSVDIWLYLLNKAVKEHLLSSAKISTTVPVLKKPYSSGEYSYEVPLSRNNGLRKMTVFESDQSDSSCSEAETELESVHSKEAYSEIVLAEAKVIMDEMVAAGIALRTAFSFSRRIESEYALSFETTALLQEYARNIWRDSDISPRNKKNLTMILPPLSSPTVSSLEPEDWEVLSPIASERGQRSCRTPGYDKWEKSNRFKGIQFDQVIGTGRLSIVKSRNSFKVNESSILTDSGTSNHITHLNLYPEGGILSLFKLGGMLGGFSPRPQRIEGSVFSFLPGTEQNSYQGVGKGDSPVRKGTQSPRSESNSPPRGVTEEDEIPSLLTSVDLCRGGDTGHQGPVLCLAGEGFRVASGSSDCTIGIYDIQQAARVALLTGHTGAIKCIKMQGEWIISGSTDRTIRVWKQATSVYPTSLPLGGLMSMLSPMDPPKLLQGHVGTVRCLDLLPVSEERPPLVVSGAEDFQVRIWKSNEQRCTIIFAGHKGTITSLATNSTQVLSGSLDKNIRLWEVEGDGGRALRRFSGHEGGVTTASFIDASLVISGAADATVRLWDKRAKKETAIFYGHEGGVTCVQLGPLGSHTIISGSADKTIKVWDIRDPNRGPIFTLKGHEDKINSILLLGSSLYSGGQDAQLREWDLSTGAFLHSYVGHFGGITSLLGTPRAVISAGWDRAVRLWPRLEPDEVL